MRKLNLFLNNKGEMFFKEMNSMSYSRMSTSRRQQAFERLAGVRRTRDIYYRNAVRFFTPVFAALAEIRSGNPMQKAIDLLKEVPERGLGTAHLLEMDSKHARVRVMNCYNALAYEVSASPVCYEMCGILAALFQAVLCKEAICRELRCASMGDEFCEFEIQFKKSLALAREKKTSTISMTSSLLLYDPRKGEVFSAGVSSVIYPRGMPASIEDDFERVIGREDTEEISYAVSKNNVSRNIRKDVMRHFFLSRLNVFFRPGLISELKKVGNVMGYGNLDVISIDKSNIKVTVRNSYNAMKRKRKTCGCFSLAGTIAGAASIILSRDAECVETECISKGDKCCVFVAETDPSLR